MVNAVCHRCGREWDYNGQSDRYGTCPNCKTSVKLEGASERAEPSETAERCPDPSERSVEIVAGAGEPHEETIPDAIVALDVSVGELYELVSDRSETVGEIVAGVEEREEAIEELEDGLGELAGYFEEMIEEAGGEVEYDHIETGEPIEEAVASVEENDVAVLGGAS